MNFSVSHVQLVASRRPPNHELRRHDGVTLIAGSRTRESLVTGGCGRYRHSVTPAPCSSAGRAGQEGGDHVGGVAVQRPAAPVVAHGGSGIGMAGCLLDIPQRHAGVEGGFFSRAEMNQPRVDAVRS